MVPASHADTNASAPLRAKFAELREQLAHNQFGRPIYLDSSEDSGSVRSDVHVIVEHPFATVGSALIKPANWCDILVLHLNTKYCSASPTDRGTVIHVHMGRKFDQPLEDTYQADFAYRVAANTQDYLEVRLGADKGPLGTHDHRIRLEAIPLDGQRTFVHFSYSYSNGITGRLAMQGYLATLGRDKVGFTIVGKQPDGRPVYVGGTLGAAERNTMRYYLAIEAFFNALSVPPQDRMEKSFRDWFAATERYPRQLHEIERDEYLAMKRKEYARQQHAQAR